MTTEPSPDFSTLASGFSSWTEQLWAPLAQQVVDAAGLKKNDAVLDACCGTGTSATPAAHQVGPQGKVDGVDLAEGMLDVARAAAPDLPQLSFHASDVVSFSRDYAYDAALCCFGVFFFPQMNAGAQALVNKLRPGGTLALSTWHGRPFMEITRLALAAVKREGYRAGTVNPAVMANIDAIGTPESLAAWLKGLGLRDIRVQSTAVSIEVTQNSAWQFVLGSLVAGMLPTEPAAVERVRQDFLSTLDHTHVAAEVLIATGKRRFPS
ncbi:MAG: methyltransferase domain-containing protein [Acidobacteria bacterium]|nr:methyltransferase domain-containing protein [Acidobacteriota bacterium]